MNWVEQDQQNHGRIDLEALEFGIRSRMQAVGGSLLEKLLNHGAGGYQGSQVDGGCGGRARFVGYREKHIHSILGEFNVKRAYYYCKKCKQGKVPRDGAFDLKGTSYTPGLRRRCCFVGAKNSFASGSEDLGELAGVAMEAKVVERIAEKVGAEIRLMEEARRDQIFSEEVITLPLESPPEKVSIEVERRGLGRAKTKVVSGDGAIWIREMAQEQFPGAIEILDLYPAREHLWKVAHALYGDEQKKKNQWAARRIKELDRGDIASLLRAFMRVVTPHDCARELLKTEYKFFKKNRQRMRYNYFRSKGLFVGSGVIEAACRTVIGERLKKSGMWWTVRGANAIISLRRCFLSGEWEDYWQSRATG